MVDAALAAGTASRDSIFELFTRRLPGARKYGVVAGTGRFLEALARFRFTDSELEWLRSEQFLSSKTLDWLADYRFSGNIYGYAEGEVFFPNSPILTVESGFAEGVILETLALSIFNADSAVATAASRMVNASFGRPLAEMGSRRTNEINAVGAARAAYIAGFAATSNLEAGRSYQIPTMGTAAHAFTLLHDSEIAAFEAQVATLGKSTTLLVDTYDIVQGVKNAVAVAGTELGAVRIDSGDLPVVVKQVRELLDSLGAHNTKITVTNDLDEFTIAALAASPVDSFGVGTSVVTGSGSPNMSMVYKLVARTDNNGNWQSVAKKAEGKTSYGGKKAAYRVYDESGFVSAEQLSVIDPHSDAVTAEFTAADRANSDDSESGAKARNLLNRFVAAGEVDPQFTGIEAIAAARQRHSASVRELPPIAMSLQRGEPAVATVFSQ